MSSSLRSASNASAAVFPDKKNCWLFSIFGVNMATPPKIPMFHATFNSSRLIWEKILLRVFQNSAMKKAAAARAKREQLRTLGETRRTAIPRQKTPLGGPRCSVFFPGCQKTRLWGLSGRLGVTEKARKGAAKREKRQESRQWGPERHAEPMQRGPLAAFPAILRAKPCNRRFPQRKIC